MMDCATFEERLTGLLAADGQDGAAAPEVHALRTHADMCADCRGSLDLIEVAALPVALRFPASEPTAGDWARFERGLAARLAAERGQERTRRRAGLASTAAAAMLAASLTIVTFEGITPPPADGSLDDGRLALDLGADPDYGPAAPVPDLDGLTDDERDALLDWIREETDRIDGGQG